MKTAVISTLVILATISTNSFAQGTVTSPKSVPKIESDTGKVVTTTSKQKNHFLKKHPSQQKELAAKRSGS